MDIGNTSTSVGLVDREKLVCIESCSFPSKNSVEQIVSAINKIQANYQGSTLYPVKICSVVRSVQSDLNTALSTISSSNSVSFVKYHEKLPVKISYDNPEILGADRIANLLYGVTKYPDENIIIIDAGTAITIDMISSDREFVGGFILPGITTQLNSLHTATSGLPLIEYDTITGSFPPNSTQSAILSGVCYEIGGGISFIIERLRKKFPDNKRIIACGGAWEAIRKFIDFEYRFIPEITLVGAGLYEK
jgi:type III pantothenate kinase